MSKIINQEIFKFKNLLIVGLLLRISAAFLSVGPHHVDEHYQILEFLGTKLYGYSTEDLPWEFAAQIRPWLHIFFFYLIGTPLKLLFSPFGVEICFRLFSTFLGFFSICYFTNWYLPQIKEHKDKLLFVVLTQLLWFFPYLGARISAEVIGGNLFLIAFTFYMSKKYLSLKDVGFISLLFAICFYFRFHMGFAIFGLCLNSLILKRKTIKELFLLTAGTIFFIGLFSSVDYWGYGKFVFTPWMYFKANIIDGVASSFGTQPFWWYLYFSQRTIGPGIGAIVVLSFFYFWFSRPKDEMTWMTLIFFILHSAVGHKEFRFLFPMAVFIPVFLFALIKKFESFANRKVFISLVGIFALINILHLIPATFRPAHASIGFIKYVKERSDIKLIYKKSSTEHPFIFWKNFVNFYGPRTIEFKKLEDKSMSSGKYLYYTYGGREYFDTLKEKRCKVLYPIIGKVENLVLYRNRAHKKRIAALWECP